MQHIFERSLGLGDIAPRQLSIGAQSAHQVVQCHQIIDGSLLRDLVNIAGQRGIATWLSTPQGVLAVVVVGISKGAFSNSPQDILLLVARPQQQAQIAARKLVSNVSSIGPLGVAVFLKELIEEGIVHGVRLQALVAHLGIEERGQIALRRAAPFAHVLLALPQLNQFLALL